MIIHQIDGNLSDLPADARASLREDRVPLTNAQLLKRIQRVTTETGEEIGLRLEKQQELRDGDILHRDDERVITIAALPTDVLVIVPEDIRSMGVIAHSLGNRHLQAQFFGPDSEYGKPVMVVQYDHTVEDFLQHTNTPHSREQRVMPAAFRHAEHSH